MAETIFFAEFNFADGKVLEFFWDFVCWMMVFVSKWLLLKIQQRLIRRKNK